jgi:hypothetical protein
MGKRGPKPKGKVKIEWSPNFAYAVGLLVSDGSLSKNGRHIVFTSKDIEQIKNFTQALGLQSISIGYTKCSDKYGSRTITRVQFGDVLFYQFLLKIGLMSNKSKVIGEVKVPGEYFFDFLRGVFDGDGCTHSYFDPRWKSSFMFYTIFTSSSLAHILWLQKSIRVGLQIKGHITGNGIRSAYQLKYAKADSLKLLPKMYSGKDLLCLGRKRLKIEQMLRTIGRSLND